MIIHTDSLCKTYRRYQKAPGLRGSVRSLFHREYEEKAALRDFTFDVSEGEFVGLIGENGAGKTTLCKLLTGIIAPTSGEISVLGYYPNKLENAFKKQYAVVMGQKSQLFFDLTSADTFLLFKEMYGIPDAEYKKNLAYFADLLDIGKLLDVQVRTLSLGERMKMELIAALLHSPRVLFLDEPTIGLDAVAQKQIRAFLRAVNEERGATILLTSHYMEDVRSLCKRCVVLSSGEKVYDGATDALFAKYQTHKRITAAFKGEFFLPPGCELLTREHDRAVFLAPIASAQEAVNALVREHELSDIAIEEDDIGTVVERIYRDRGRAQ